MSDQRLPLDPRDSAVVLVDHQVGLLNMVNSLPREVVASSDGMLARLAERTGAPLLIATTDEESGFAGTSVSERQETAPVAYACRGVRAGAPDAFKDSRFAEAVEATGRQTLIMAGILTDACLWRTSASALEAGHHVRVMADASGSASDLADRVTNGRRRALGQTSARSTARHSSSSPIPAPQKASSPQPSHQAMTSRSQLKTPPAMGQEPAPLIAFVFAGGTSVAAMQAGMLQALHERGIVPDFLAGTSAGALNAAFVSSRPHTVATAKQLGEVWRGLRREAVFPISPRLLLAGLTNHSDHLVPDSGVRVVARRHLQIERLEQASTALRLVSFDLLDGQEVRLSEGPALDAVLAAASIPGVLPPVRLGGRLLVDGGVANNTPISHVIELGAQRIYALETHDPLERGLSAAPGGPLDAAVRAVSLLIADREQACLSRYAQAPELVVLPAVNPGHSRATDFDRADQLIRSGLLSARRVLAATPASPIFRGCGWVVRVDREAVRGCAPVLVVRGGMLLWQH